MTSRERILTAVSHREPDRVPFDLGGLGPSGISLEAYQSLLAFLKSDEKAELGDMASQRAKPSEKFLRRFGVDTRPLRIRAQGSGVMNIQENADSLLIYDEWGIGRKMARIQGHHYFIFHNPLSQVETEDLTRYPWPDPVDPNRLEGVEREASTLRAEADPAFILGSSFSQGLLQFAAQLEGHERFFLNLALDPFRVEWILEKLLEMKLRFYEWALTRLDGWVDIICESDDFGHQTSQWLSLEMFQKFVKPRYTKLFSSLKKRYGVKIMLHSCGAVYPLIPEIIEMGVDILNPLQLGAMGMGDTRRLKKEFGDSLTFWGGGIDVQQTLPFETPQRVEDEVQRRIEDLSPGGGFVFAATQAIQPETPPANVMAMWRALQRYGIYSGSREKEG